MWGKIRIGILPLLYTKLWNPLKAKDDLNRGWDHRICFMSLEAARCRSCQTRDPIMVIVQDDGAACNKFKEKVFDHGQLWRLNKELIMVQVTEAEIDDYCESLPTHLHLANNLRPGGLHYVPRIMFYPPPDKSWFVKDAVHSEADRDRKFFYSCPEELFTNARLVFNHQF